MSTRRERKEQIMKKLALIVVIAGLAAAPAAQASQRDDYGNGMRPGGSWSVRASVSLLCIRAQTAWLIGSQHGSGS
jgi:hypothetical protein